MIYLSPNPDIITQFGIPVSLHKTRQVCDGDFYSFTHILVADNSNLRVNALLCKKPHDSTAEVTHTLMMNQFPTHSAETSCVRHGTLCESTKYVQLGGWGYGRTPDRWCVFSAFHGLLDVYM